MKGYCQINAPGEQAVVPIVGLGACRGCIPKPKIFLLPQEEGFEISSPNNVLTM